MSILRSINNSICVISKQGDEDNFHDIQTNSSWQENPYKDYAIVPKNMIQDILETRGFCDIELNEEGTEVVSFTAKEIPEIPTPVKAPTTSERLTALENAMLEMLGVSVNG